MKLFFTLVFIYLLAICVFFVLFIKDVHAHECPQEDPIIGQIIQGTEMAMRYASEGSAAQRADFRRQALDSQNNQIQRRLRDISSDCEYVEFYQDNLRQCNAMMEAFLSTLGRD